MKILAVDSSAVTASAAVYENERIISEGFVNNGLTHSQTLLPITDGVVENAGLSYDDIDLFAVTVGPGSFTGVRIGVSTVKGLAFAKEKSCVAVSSLEAIAFGCDWFNGVVCCAMDARRNQVYNALFKAENGVLTRLCDDRAIAIDELLKELDEQYPDAPVIISGDGAALVYNSAENERCLLAPQNVRYVRGSFVAKAAQIQVESGKICSADELNPVYLRMSQAERELSLKKN